MAKRKPRTMISYWVCCDCHRCLGEIGSNSGFKVLGFAFDTEQEARKDLEKDEDSEYRDHLKPLFIAKEIIEEIIPIPQRKPKRKAAYARNHEEYRKANSLLTPERKRQNHD